ncbi:MAG: hypothetical protein AAFP76_13485 [Bacteroidota bacterium]
MKKLVPLLFIGGLSCLISCSSDDTQETDTTQNDSDPVVALTSIPDPAFEQGLIDLGYDSQLDGSVETSRIENVTDLVLNEKGITTVTGLADFKNLVNLWLNGNELNSINVSNNSKLQFCYVENNNLSSIGVSNLEALEKLAFSGNRITSIVVSNNTSLQVLEMAGNNVESLDVSNNPQLNILKVSNNPLTCIEVSESQLNNIPQRWEKDEEDSYALECN